LASQSTKEVTSSGWFQVEVLADWRINNNNLLHNRKLVIPKEPTNKKRYTQEALDNVHKFCGDYMFKNRFVQPIKDLKLKHLKSLVTNGYDCFWGNLSKQLNLPEITKLADAHFATLKAKDAPAMVLTSGRDSDVSQMWNGANRRASNHRDSNQGNFDHDLVPSDLESYASTILKQGRVPPDSNLIKKTYRKLQKLPAIIKNELDKQADTLAELFGPEIPCLHSIIEHMEAEKQELEDLVQVTEAEKLQVEGHLAQSETEKQELEV
jgi:hypothetical protein